MSQMKIQKTPSIRRMPTYLYKLVELQAEGVAFVSTTVLANYMGIESIVVRKDFAITGVTGQSGVGYKTDELIAAIRCFLGWDSTVDACLVGAGSLGSALLGYDGFVSSGSVPLKYFKIKLLLLNIDINTLILSLISIK